MKGFREFLLRGNLIELAVAVVIGAAFGAIVTSLVKDMITPLIAAVGGQSDFGGLYFTINNSRFMYGNFINAALTFLIIAAVVYFLIVLPYVKFRSRFFPEPTPETRKCPECLMPVALEAKRCAHCTSPLTPVSGAAGG